MENTPKFRLRLNLFDGIVLVLALAVGALLLWTTLKPQTSAAADEPATVTTTVRYTIRFQKWLEGTGALVEVGDKLVDNIKNFDMGYVVSAEVVPAQAQVLDHDGRQYVLTEIDGYEDVLVTVESECTVDDSVYVGGGYALQVGEISYIRGEGYMASGPIIAIEREGLE